MAAKLGFVAFAPDQDRPLTDDLLRLLPEVETDMSLFFRQLALVPTEAGLSAAKRIAPLLDVYYQPEQLTAGYRQRLSAWLERYSERVRWDNLPDAQRKARMNAVNPLYVLRNYLAQLAIDKVLQGEYSIVADLLEVLHHPYDVQSGKERFAEKRPEWARNRAGCSMLSCSS